MKRALVNTNVTPAKQIGFNVSHKLYDSFELLFHLAFTFLRLFRALILFWFYPYKSLQLCLYTLRYHLGGVSRWGMRL